VRAHGLRHPHRAPGPGGRRRAGPRVAHRLAAARRGVGRRPRHGGACRVPPGHGRAVRHERTRDPRHQDPREQAVTEHAARQPYAPFRPRAARLVASTLAVLALVLAVLLAVVVPDSQAGILDRIGFVGFGALIAWFLYRQATVRAVPDEHGLTV